MKIKKRIIIWIFIIISFYNFCYPAMREIDDGAKELNTMFSLSIETIGDYMFSDMRLNFGLFFYLSHLFFIGPDLKLQVQWNDDFTNRIFGIGLQLGLALSNDIMFSIPYIGTGFGYDIFYSHINKDSDEEDIASIGAIKVPLFVGFKVPILTDVMLNIEGRFEYLKFLGGGEMARFIALVGFSIFF